MGSPRLAAPIGWTVPVGAVMWLVQPLYILTEVATAAKVNAPYSFAANTISDLAARSCGPVRYPLGPVQVCSPWHQLMNGSFIGFGLLLAFGAILLRRGLPPGALATTSVVLWVIAGASSIATGLVPLDQNLGLHALVSTPVLLVQPAALIIVGMGQCRGHQGIAWSALAAGIVSEAAAIATVTELGSPDFAGAIERLALWPAYLVLPAISRTVLSRRGPR